MKNFYLPKKLFLSILICLISNNDFINSFIILPFSFKNKNSNILSNNPTPKEYFEYYLKGGVYTTININKKPLDFHLTLDRYTTYISEKTLQEIDPKSAEVQKNEDLYSLEYIGIYRAKYANTLFSFLSNTTKNISLNNYSFFMMRKFTDNFEYEKKRKYLATEDSEIGFNVLKGNRIEKVEVEQEEIDPYDKGDMEEEEITGEKYVYKNNGYLIEENTNIISQLKNYDFISSDVFMIKYEDEKKENGKIIIGGKPHEYDPWHYNEKYFVSYYTNRGEMYSNWGITFQDIQFNDKNYTSIKSAEITLDFPFILGNERLMEFLNNDFFKLNKYSKYCGNETIDKYFVFYCQESVIKDFKKLTFVLQNQYNLENKINVFEFNYKDLFIKANGKSNLYYFQIVFEEGYFSLKLGLPLFKKYPLVFDRDGKTFGFYTETGKYDVDNDSDSKKLSFAWILVIILSICFIGLAIAFYLILPKIRRKKKANELDDDDYDYSAKDEKDYNINY